MFNFFKKSPKIPFRFHEPESTTCFTCDHVLSKKRSILYVTHDKDDGTWQFLCGQNDHTEKSTRIISLEEACKLDATLNELYEMPIGYIAERNSDKDKWIPFKQESVYMNRFQNL